MYTHTCIHIHAKKRKEWAVKQALEGEGLSAVGLYAGRLIAGHATMQDTSRAFQAVVQWLGSPYTYSNSDSAGRIQSYVSSPAWL